MAFAGFTIIFLIASAFVISILLVARSIRRVNNDDGTKKNMFRRVTVVLGIVLSTAAFVTASSLVVWFVHGNFQRTQNNKRDAVYVFENGHWCWIFDYASGEYEIDGDIYGYK